MLSFHLKGACLNGFLKTVCAPVAPQLLSGPKRENGHKTETPLQRPGRPPTPCRASTRNVCLSTKAVHTIYVREGERELARFFLRSRYMCMYTPTASATARG
ncbi:hypothetical protein ElyMa_002530600 [Elysia marginata]|uniref:Uncharacterized protein n=1 Tax=Elysia marginata TaxID=1093978 RepID=A0AAV4GT04_9GAST|nr:hypothetical protein ElyMa_002530600 [Elysia marginata]